MNEQEKRDILKRLDRLHKEILQIVEYVAASSDLRPEIKARVEKFEAERRCLSCEEKILKKERIVRGCHARCANYLHRAVESGETTWDTLIRNGRALLPGKPGPKPKGLPVQFTTNPLDAAEMNPDAASKEIEARRGKRKNRKNGSGAG